MHSLRKKKSFTTLTRLVARAVLDSFDPSVLNNSLWRSHEYVLFLQVTVTYDEGK